MVVKPVEGAGQAIVNCTLYLYGFVEAVVIALEEGLGTEHGVRLLGRPVRCQNAQNDKTQISLDDTRWPFLVLDFGPNFH